MKKSILVLGIACACTVAMAQSDTRQSQNANPTTREQGTGMATGKRQHKPMLNVQAQSDEQGVQTARETGSGMATGRLKSDGIVHRDLAARETGAGMATGLAAQDSGDGQDTKHKNTMTGANSNPLYEKGGMQGSNPLYESQQRATKTRSNIQNNRVATGDVDGDGAAEVVVKSKSNITNNRADGAPDTSAPAQMKGDFSRGHQPDKRASDASAGKGNEKATTPREAGSGMATGKRQHN